MYFEERIRSQITFNLITVNNFISLFNHLNGLQVYFSGLPCGSVGKESACNAGNLGLIPGLGRSPGEGKGYPCQYSGLENSMDCIVHRVAKTQLSNFHFHFYFSGISRDSWQLEFLHHMLWCQLNNSLITSRLPLAGFT